MLSYKYNKKISTWSGWPLRGSTWSPTRNNKLKSCLLSAFQEGRHYWRLWYSKFFVFLSHHFSTHFYNITFCPYPLRSPSLFGTGEGYHSKCYNSMWQILLFRLQQYVTNIVVQGPVVEKVDNAIHQINCCPVDSLIFIGWSVIYSLDSDI